MKRLLVALILLLNVVAHADTPARVRMRVRLPFEPDNPGAVVLPVGTLVTVLWPQDDKLMIRYRRVEGLVPAMAIDYVASAHPGDVRQYRPDPAPKENDNAPAPVEHAANTYHAQTSTGDKAGNDAMKIGSFPLPKVLGGLGVVILVLIFASRGGKNEDSDGLQLRRQR